MNEQNFFNSCKIYFCGMEKCESGHFFGPAVRNQYLLHYIESGKGVYVVNGVEYELKSGELFLIKPSELTFYKADAIEPWHYMWIAFDGYEVKKILQDCGIEYITHVKNKKRFSEILRELIIAYNNDENNEYACLSLFFGMFSQLAKIKNDKNDNYSIIYFKKAVTFICNNFIHCISVADIADHVGVERTYLYKIFMENSGISPKKYLLDIQIKSAIQILMQDKFTLTQIANSTGFKDASSFCKHFKNLMGVTPSVYKRNTQIFNKNSGNIE